jgi:hypothetical protein
VFAERKQAVVAPSKKHGYVTDRGGVLARSRNTGGASGWCRCASDRNIGLYATGGTVVPPLPSLCFFKGECDLGQIHATHAPLARKKKQGGRCATHGVQRSSALHGTAHAAASDACIRTEVSRVGKGERRTPWPGEGLRRPSGIRSNRRSGANNPKATYRDTSCEAVPHHPRLVRGQPPIFFAPRSLMLSVTSSGQPPGTGIVPSQYP